MPATGIYTVDMYDICSVCCFCSCLYLAELTVQLETGCSNATWTLTKLTWSISRVRPNLFISLLCLILCKTLMKQTAPELRAKAAQSSLFSEQIQVLMASLEPRARLGLLNNCRKVCVSTT